MRGFIVSPFLSLSDARSFHQPRRVAVWELPVAGQSCGQVSRARRSVHKLKCGLRGTGAG